MKEVELKSFIPIYAFIGWLGIPASPWCSLYSNHFQQKLCEHRLSAVVSQFNYLRILKRHATTTKYCRLKSGTIADISLVSFADASHKKEASQLYYIVGSMIGLVQNGNQFHLLSWASNRSRRPAKSMPAAEILAATEAVDEIVMLKRLLLKFLGVEVKSMIVVNPNKLYHAIYSKKNKIDKFVRPDVKEILFCFETTVVVFAWIPVSLNRAGVGTKLESP